MAHSRIRVLVPMLILLVAGANLGKEYSVPSYVALLLPYFGGDHFLCKSKAT